MARHKRTEEPDIEPVETTEEPTPIAEPVASIAGTYADKWGIPALCLESIQYAVKQTSATWPGLLSLAQDHEGQQAAAFDVLGQTLTRAIPFNGFMAEYLKGGDFEKWARETAKGLSPEHTTFAGHMIDYTHKEG